MPDPDLEIGGVRGGGGHRDPSIRWGPSASSGKRLSVRKRQTVSNVFAQEVIFIDLTQKAMK